MDSSENRKRKASHTVFGDRKLVPRIRELILSNDVYPDVDSLLSELQKKFPDYRRRQHSAFKVAIDRALCILNDELSDDEFKGAKKPFSLQKASGEKKLDTDQIIVVKEENSFSNGVNDSINELYVTRNQSAKKKKKRKSDSIEEAASDQASKEVKKALLKQVELREKYLLKPRITFEDLGGIDDVIGNIMKMLFHVQHPQIFHTLGIEAPRGFLLHGPPGVGKTVIVEAITFHLNIPCLKCGSTELIAGISGESEGKIRDLFNLAKSMEPCILFIDEIDAIATKRDIASREMERRIVTQLITCLDDLGNDSRVLVIGATSRPDAIDAGLRRAGRFDREISIGIPDEDSRLSILKVICRKVKLPDDFDFQSLAHKTPGYVGADLKCLIREAAIQSLERFLNFSQNTLPKDYDIDALISSLKIEMQDFDCVLKYFQPSAKREGFATVPDVTWDQIGALKEIREELQMSIVAPIKYREDIKALGLTTSMGVLLCGPPGCGKTLLAKAIANESGLNFISVKGPELLNMYVGESERAVRSVFLRASNSKPCVIFFDEIDALCPKRTDSESTNVSSRIVNQLLTEMDGLEARSCFLLAATNRPDILDPAVLRPGRFDKIIYVGLPNEDDRFDILKTITKNKTKPLCSSNVNLETIAKGKRLQGFTGADLNALVREASLCALKDKLNGKIAKDKAIVVSVEHFETAMQKIRPSVSKEEFQKYENMKKRCIER
ncbi:nuclear valosin-containing-like protein [Dinothrombium tinctorium]|uniref:Nuclear valosin-containing-like protein n=1 Tax=Dinothrombium tinctorium TaxID=1965070 RepID=A0A3S3P3G6_9ACAR|nr:nuclear valosin-containing-like protein [Dinothrombium tinctorium]RWS11298.1 nuclear valosin-containing-like protein [Dinothrombium tinctorium]